ncbi:autotransporter outer membrane beta-barrel domain-containing protein [Achromobacter sp. DH1f]|uniref:autotransporter outer membrane beta-barrel domain-containing protein n=1 Tax=Achromobacter sp. DH1f TaxID=1397275 RepID=UPI000469184C|nr:autotransporter outer membrane beta-barrel domain-containing protein [Achromobacter sp. DH1f]
MNIAYRIIWSAASQAWVVVSECTRTRGKRSGVRRASRRSRAIAHAGGVLALACGPGLAFGQVTEYTPDTANNGGQTIAVNGGTASLDGEVKFSPNAGPPSRPVRAGEAYRLGYLTGPVDPDSLITIRFGSKNSGQIVVDPVTQSSVVVNTYSDAAISSGAVPNTMTIFGGASTPGSVDMFIGASLAEVSGGGTFNMNATGSIGNDTVKNTVYISVTDGVANWNSNNTVTFASREQTVAPNQLDPYTLNITSSTFNGTFEVQLADGQKYTHTVGNLNQLRAYNTWLIGQLQAGKLGVGAAAQAAYDNALGRAYTNSTISYQATPSAGPVDPTNPMLQPAGTQVGMLADGANATGHVTATGVLANAFDAGGGTLLKASNGGTIINDGIVTSIRLVTGMAADSGGHLINNGVRNLGDQSGRNAEIRTDTVAGVGTTYVNNGVVNLAQWSWDQFSTVNSFALSVSAGAEAVNHGTFNVGTRPGTSNGRPTGVVVGGGTGIASFTNSADGVIYLGRAASSNVTAAPVDRGGADVKLARGAVGIQASSGNTLVRNEGTIVIGDKVQAGIGMLATGSGVNVINSGTIEVYGHYSDAPLVNSGMQSTSQSGVVDNAGIINLRGINNVGVQALWGGRASSSGTINVVAGVDDASGLRNYAIWSEGANSKATLSGVVNLSGDGAIGVHARNSGSVGVAGSGVVNFTGGTNQIGYFAFGPGSKITNNSSSAQNVSTEGSTLFRVADGADFTGAAGATSTLIASGKNSVAMLMTGVTGTDVSAFNSGGMTIDLAGVGATGVRIEGGAQGKIASTAVINMNDPSATGAIAGIADGQKYDLSGIAVGDAVGGVLTNGMVDAGASGFGTGTILVSGAMLNSDLSGVTGYIARNGGELMNFGDIVFTGSGATGLLVEAGARGGNSGTITVGAGGTGIRARDSSGLLATNVNTSGNLVLNGGDVSNRSVGISASGASTTVNMTGGSIQLNGNGAIGVEALNGATVNLSGSATPSFAAGATGQILFRLVGAGASINTNVPAGNVFDASAKNAILYRLDDGASLSGQIQVAASGENAKSIYATGAGTTVNVASGSRFNLSGAGAQGLYVSGGAQATVADGTIMNLTRAGATAGLVDGNLYALDGTTVLASNTGATLTNGATLNSTQTGAVGFITQNLGVLVNNGNLRFSGADSQAIRVLGSEFRNTGNIHANGAAIYVEGAGAVVDNQGGQVLALDGRAAVELGSGASLDLLGSGLGTVEGRGDAHAVLINSGATALNVRGAHLVVNAAGARGNGIENAGEIAGIQLLNTTIDVTDGIGLRTGATINKENSGTINVAGAGAGIAFQAADGSQIGSSLDLSDSQDLTIKVTGAGGRGIVANTTGTVNTAVNVDIHNAAGGSALVLGNGVTSVVNGGRLTSTSTVAATVATNKVNDFLNTATGSIVAPNGAGTALAFDDQSTTLVNLGRIAGLVDLGAGSNILNNNGTIDGDVVAGLGNNAFSEDGGTITGEVRFTGASGTNSLTLTNGSSIGSFLGSGGSDTVTIRGAGNQFTSLYGGTGYALAVFDNASYTLSDSQAIRAFDEVSLRNVSTLTLQTALIGKPAQGAAIFLDGKDTTLAIKPVTASAFTLGNVLTGTGVVQVDTGGSHAFDFASSAGTAFTGTLAMDRGTFALAGVNTAALSHATLKMGANSVTSVGNGTQSISGLTFDGGTLIFNATLPGQATASGSINVTTLDASGAGAVRVTVPDSLVLSPPNTPNGLNLLAQDDANTSLKLVNAGAVLGSAGAVALQDQNGTAITSAREMDFTQGGDVVAKGTYDFRLTTAPGDGLYINYGLTALALQSGKTLTLAQDTGATGADADLSAKLSGSGGVSIDARTGVLSLSNADSTYQGETGVASGTLRLDASGALGQTSALRIAANAAVDMNGKTQAIGTLAGLADSLLDLHDGVLTIANGGSSAGRLAGAGALNLTGGTLTVLGANTGLSARTTIDSGASAVLNSGAGLGSGGIANAGTLQLKGVNGALGNALSGAGSVKLTDAANVTLAANNSGFSGSFATDTGTTLTATQAANLGTASIANAGTLILDGAGAWTLDNAVSGTGNLAKRGGGTVTVGSNLAYTGKTSIEAGTLVFGGPAQPGVTLGGAGAGTVTVAAGAALIGDGTVSGDVVNAGSLGVFNALDNRRSATPGTLTLANGLTNSGTLYAAGGVVGNTVRVVGNYVGQGGSIVMAVFKGGDTSAADKLVVDGGSASGDTGLVIRHGGGSGAMTTEGIRLVETVNGGTTDANAFHLDARSDGYRQGVGLIAAGAYDYRLARGGQGGTADDWYLVSHVSTLPPLITVVPLVPGQIVDPGPVVDPVTPAPQPDVKANYRPEVGAYLNNKLAASTQQQHSLRDRIGYAPGADGKPERAGWVRMVRGQDSRDGAGTIKDTSTSYLIHGGSDLLRFSVGKEGSMRVGAMASYGTNSSRARSNGLSASGKVEGYNVGVYGTWFGNADILTGPYVDTWMMLGRYDNTVDGQGLAKEHYRSRASSASVEAGYSFKLYDNGTRQLALQPQAQAIVTRYQAGDHLEKTGTRVSDPSQTSVTTRVGVRLQGRIDNAQGVAQMLPFAELNWLRGPASQTVRFDGQAVREQLPANRVELKAGLQGNVTKSLTLSGSLGLETGARNYQDASGQIGVKYAW